MDLDELIYQFKNAVVSIKSRSHFEHFSEWRYFYRPPLIPVSKGHYIRHTDTDVIYHYYGKDNRNKDASKIRNNESYGKRFYKRQLEYKGWYYDLPKSFDIRKDWEKVLLAYLKHLNDTDV